MRGIHAIIIVARHCLAYSVRTPAVVLVYNILKFVHMACRSSSVPDIPLDESNFLHTACGPLPFVR